MSDEKMDLDPVEAPRPRPRKVPRVRTRHPGKVNRILEGLAQMFKDHNGEWDCRWVYHPEHKKELSNVIARKSEGYQHVALTDLGDDITDFIDGDEVRVGDVVLMKISRVEREELKEELAERAQEQSNSIDSGFYEEVEGVETRSKSGEVHRARPRGRTVIEERDLEIDQEQRSSE